MSHSLIYDLDYLNSYWETHLPQLLETDNNKLVFLIKEEIVEFLRHNKFVKMEVLTSEVDEEECETIEFEFKNSHYSNWRMFVYDDRDWNGFLGINTLGHDEMAIVGDIIYEFYKKFR